MSEKGSLSVEAALVLPLLLVVMVACLQVMSAISIHQQLVAAAREGARVAATVPDPARAVQAVRDTLSGEISERVKVTVRRPQVVGEMAEVVVFYQMPLRGPFLDLRFPITARAVMRVEL